ncbi:hypothetical protein PG999_011375 [Apiospora kogelbergensis]|uniref:Uncharacterized protein n=1 Tax=Apiospora kogelbergensis TaxID=1337665 RepID=A0AAW0QNM4_9PEZI
MRSAIILGAAALVAASPAPQALDLNAVHDAPAPTGPAMGVVSQASVYNAAAASSSATAAASAVASAVANAPEKRSLEARTFCFWWYCPKPSAPQAPAPPSGGGYGNPQPPSPPNGGYGNPQPPSPPNGGPQPPAGPTPTGYGTVPMTTPSVPQQTTTTAAATTVTSPVPTSTGIVPSSCTPVSWTNTFIFTTATDCAKPFEEGTYCGFINPEDPCAPQPDGYAPRAKVDSAAGFVADAALHKIAQSAKDPKGYASTFKDLTAAVNANTYLGFDTLKSYDVDFCANKCDNTNLCTSFNIYMERDPAWNGEKCSCPMPDSMTNYKCSYWGSGVTPDAAVNKGQTRGDGFEVVITGSNGYSKTNTTTPETPSGCSKPTKCGAVHDHPRTCLGQHFFPGPFDVSLCSTYAQAQNAKNVASNKWSQWMSYFGYNPSKCNFFNAFMIKENGVAKGTYCKLFTQQYDSSAATYEPGWQGSSHYEVESSWSYCL